MADGYVERGEVYWIGKIGLANLGVIISSKQDNVADGFVAVATICGEKTRRGVSIEITGRQSWVVCSNIRTVPKKELRTLVSRLTREEMRQVDNELEQFFDLGYEDDGKDEEIADLKAEVARLKREVEYGKEGILSRAAEVAKYKKLYDKAVDQIADMTLAADVAKRIAEKTAEVERKSESEEFVEEPVEQIEESEPEEPPVVEESESEVEVEFAPEVVNVNTASAQEISNKTGLPMKDAYAITGYRNKNGLFAELEELLEVSRISKQKFEKYKEWFTLEEPEQPSKITIPVWEPPVAKPKTSELVKKVNVNKATMAELMDLGFSKSAAGRITTHIKKYGPYKKVEDLKGVDDVPSKLIRKLKDVLEV